MKDIIKFDIKFPITASPVVDDINNDSRNELIISADKIYIFDLTSQKLITTLETTKPCASTPAIIEDIDGNKILIVGSDDDNLYFFKINENKKLFKFPTGGDIFSSPVVQDVDNDGFKEIIFGSDDGRVYKVKIDENCEILNYDYLQTNGFVSSSPSLLPNNDNTFDIVIGSWDENLYRIDAKTFQCKWKTNLSHIIWSNPVVCDINSDGNFEIISVTNQLNLLDKNGKEIAPFPVKLNTLTIASPIIYDIDCDGSPEIIVCSNSLNIFSLNGELKNSENKIRSIFWSSPILVDINGDDKQEIIACDYFGNIWFYSNDGKPVGNSPIKISSSIVSSPIATDADNDGLIEIVVCTMDGTIWIFPTSGKKSEWNNFRGNNKNGLVPQKFENLSKINFTTISDRENKENTLVIEKLTISKEKRGKIKLWELKVRISPEGCLKRGIMFFFKNGKWFPSPLFGDGENFIARFPPLRKFTIMRYFLLLENWKGQTFRFPEKSNRLFITI